MAAQNLRTAVAMAVDGKSRAALFRVFCSPFRSSSPPLVLQSRAALFLGSCSPFCSSSSSPVLMSDHITAGDGGPAPAAATIIPTPPPNLPPPFDQNAAGGAPGLKGRNDIIRRPKHTREGFRHWCPPLPGRIKRLNPANDPDLISLADFCVQQISQIQDSQYKLVKIVEADMIIFAGYKIRITLELSNQDGSLRKYRFEVWERKWLKFRQLLSWDPVD